MIIMDTDVLNALAGDSELVTLLGGDYIWNTEADDATQFPRVVFFELNNIDKEYQDDLPINSEIYYQIDAYSYGSTTDMAKRIDAVMTSLGFYRYASSNQYEKDNKVFHKALRYKIKKQL